MRGLQQIGVVDGRDVGVRAEPVAQNVLAVHAEDRAVIRSTVVPVASALSSAGNGMTGISASRAGLKKNGIDMRSVPIEGLMTRCTVALR